jgi:hypothetical protein
VEIRRKENTIRAGGGVEGTNHGQSRKDRSGEGEGATRGRKEGTIPLVLVGEEQLTEGRNSSQREGTSLNEGRKE